MKCYETLVEILPECIDILNLAQNNLNLWRKMDEDKKRKERGEDHILDSSDILPPGLDLGFMLRGGMWVIERSRNSTDNNR